MCSIRRNTVIAVSGVSRRIGSPVPQSGSPGKDACFTALRFVHEAMEYERVLLPHLPRRCRCVWLCAWLRACVCVKQWDMSVYFSLIYQDSVCVRACVRVCKAMGYKCVLLPHLPRRCVCACVCVCKAMNYKRVLLPRHCVCKRWDTSVYLSFTYQDGAGVRGCGCVHAYAYMFMQYCTRNLLLKTHLMYTCVRAFHRKAVLFLWGCCIHWSKPLQVCRQIMRSGSRGQIEHAPVFLVFL